MPECSGNYLTTIRCSLSEKLQESNCGVCTICGSMICTSDREDRDTNEKTGKRKRLLKEVIMIDLKKAREFRDFHKAEYMKYLDRTEEARTFLNDTEKELKDLWKTGDAQKAVVAVVLNHCNDEKPILLNTEVFVHFPDWTVEVQTRVLDSQKDCDTDFRWSWRQLRIPIDDIPGLMGNSIAKENLEKYYIENNE